MATRRVLRYPRTPGERRTAFVWLAILIVVAAALAAGLLYRHERHRRRLAAGRIIEARIVDIRRDVCRDPRQASITLQFAWQVQGADVVCRATIFCSQAKREWSLGQTVRVAPRSGSCGDVAVVDQPGP